MCQAVVYENSTRKSSQEPYKIDTTGTLCSTHFVRGFKLGQTPPFQSVLACVVMTYLMSKNALRWFRNCPDLSFHKLSWFIPLPRRDQGKCCLSHFPGRLRKIQEWAGSEWLPISVLLPSIRIFLVYPIMSYFRGSVHPKLHTWMDLS